MIVFVACLFVLVVLGCEDKTARGELAALRIGNQVEGNFLLGIGSIGGSPKIYFMRKLSGGGYRVTSHPAAYSTIFEDVVLPERPYYTYRMSAWCLCPERAEYEFHIPAGAIVHDFSVDLNDFN